MNVLLLTYLSFNQNFKQKCPFCLIFISRNGIYVNDAYFFNYRLTYQICEKSYEK